MVNYSGKLRSFATLTVLSKSRNRGVSEEQSTTRSLAGKIGRYFVIFSVCKVLVLKFPSGE